MPKRRVALLAAAIAAVLAILLGLFWFVWAPSAVRARLAEAAERRGLRSSVGSVHIGLFTLVLEDVQVVNANGRPSLRVAAAEVTLDAGLVELATSGSDAVEHVDVRGVEVRANLDAPALQQIARDLRGPSGAERGQGVERTIDVDELRVVLRDRSGVLFSIADARAVLSPGGRARMRTGAIELAPDEADGARARGGSLRLLRGDGGWRISFASLSGVEVRYRERTAGEHSPLWRRIRRHAAQMGAAAGDEVRRVEQPAAVAIAGRARDLLGSRLTPDAILELEDLSVHTGAGARRQTVLRDLQAEVRSLAGGRFALRGSGHPGRGGRLGWRLVVDPDELRAEGSVDFQRVPFVLLVPILPTLPFHHPEDARVSGELDIEGRGATQVHLEGEVTIDDLAVSSARIAPGPVRASRVSFSGEADWNPTSRHLVVPRATLAVGDAQAHLEGSFEWPDDHYLIDVRATLPPTDCNAAIGAIPSDLLGELAAFTFTGDIGAGLRARVDSRDLDATELDIDVADGCAFRTAPRMADVRRFEAPFRHRVLEPDLSSFEMETGPGTSNWTSIGEMSPYLLHAVLGHEDGGFASHRGFSVPSIRLALIRNLHAGRYVYGASTITMQLVKNVFLHREKTLARKVQEVLLTWWIESVMPKERILELYLNVIEYGPSVYGIRNAAEHYFGCEPSALGPAQAAYLANILPNPKLYHSHWETGEVPERFRRRVERFLRTMESRRRYRPQAVAQAIAELPSLRFARPGERWSPEIPRGGAAPLPFGASLDDAWQEELGPDDPDGEDQMGVEEDFPQ